MRRALSFGSRVLALLSCVFAASPAAAHDSWLSRIDTPQRAGPARFAFTTGSLYPLVESSPAPHGVARAACVGAQGRTRELRRQVRGTTLELHMPAASPPDAPLGCWAELREHAATLTPELVEVYFREIRPPAAVAARWTLLREQGTPWEERYRKFARVESAPPGTPAPALRAIRAPAGLPLEIVVLGDAPLRAGQAAAFQVLAQGTPVAGLAVELRSERSPIGIWSQSDAEGRLRFTPPFGGEWLLRATLLEADTASSSWHSRFVTLVFRAH
jgi:uncharacterized GH25 family protein